MPTLLNRRDTSGSHPRSAGSRDKEHARSTQYGLPYVGSNAVAYRACPFDLLFRQRVRPYLKMHNDRFRTFAAFL